MLTDYSRARRLGERAYRKAVMQGKYPYLPALEEIVEGIDHYPEISLGTAEIPLDMIVGTRTSGRKNAFASNFMPLMADNTEFAQKWSNLYDSQVEEGIRDPVKVYEFLNSFYVEEGNKRVSVMRYVGAVSIPANIIRIRPPRTDTEQSRIYYEFLDFYKVTHMFEITFSAPGRYEHLARILEQNLRDPWPEDLLEKLHVGLIAFRSVWTARGGARLGITVGDALLVYLGIYSLDSLIREGSDEIGKRISRLRNEYIIAAKPDRTALIERREDAETVSKKTPLTRVVQIVEKTNAAGVTHAADIAGAVAGIAGGAGAAVATRDVVKSGLESVIPGAATGNQEKYSPANPLRIAFMHEKSIGNSGWVYGHELGRNHLKDAFGSLIQTMSFENCSTEEEILNAFDTAKEEHCGVIFTTAASLAPYALRFALENPSVHVLNCGINHMQHAVRFYYGKMFEAKFLMGALASSLNESHSITYFAGKKDQAAISNVNAFALGAQLIDPYSRIRLRWVEEGKRQEDSEDDQCLCGAGGSTAERIGGPEQDDRCSIHFFSDIDMIRPDETDRRYGVYIQDDEGRLQRLAAPIWHWGSFYEIIVRRVLNGTYDSIPDKQKDTALNYWLGISSGIIDIIMSDELPRPSRKLIKQLRKGIVEGWINPFEGVLYDRDGNPHGEEDGVMTSSQIMEMDWLVENVDESKSEESAASEDISPELP